MLGGTIVGGLLGEALGPRPAMLVGAVGALPAALWLLWSPVRALHTLPAVSEDAAGEGATS
jgi:predicted MFS family arabinose efflux permease